MFKIWWEYEWAVIRRAWKETKWTTFLGWSLFLGCLGFFGQWKMGVQSEHDALVKSGVAFGCAIIGGLCVLSIKLMFLPAKMADEQEEKLDSMVTADNAIVQSQKQEIQRLTEQLKNNQAQIEHDKKIFEKLNSIADETTVRDICIVVGSYQHYDYDNYKKVTDLEHYGIQDENQFLTAALRDEFLKFHKELEAFTTIVAHVFFAVGDQRYMVYPELKHSDDDRKRQIYENARIEARDASYKVLDAYSSYRKSVKRVLFL